MKGRVFDNDCELANKMHGGAKAWLEGTEFPPSATNINICVDIIARNMQAVLESYYEVVEEELRREQQ